MSKFIRSFPFSGLSSRTGMPRDRRGVRGMGFLRAFAPRVGALVQIMDEEGRPSEGLVMERLRDVAVHDWDPNVHDMAGCEICHETLAGRASYGPGLSDVCVQCVQTADYTQARARSLRSRKSSGPGLLTIRAQWARIAAYKAAIGEGLAAQVRNAIGPTAAAAAFDRDIADIHRARTRVGEFQGVNIPAWVWELGPFFDGCKLTPQQWQDGKVCPVEWKVWRDMEVADYPAAAKQYPQSPKLYGILKAHGASESQLKEFETRGARNAMGIGIWVSNTPADLIEIATRNGGMFTSCQDWLRGSSGEHYWGRVFANVEVPNVLVAWAGTIEHMAARVLLRRGTKDGAACFYAERVYGDVGYGNALVTEIARATGWVITQNMAEVEFELVALKGDRLPYSDGGDWKQTPQGWNLVDYVA